MRAYSMSEGAVGLRAEMLRDLGDFVFGFGFYSGYLEEM